VNSPGYYTKPLGIALGLCLMLPAAFAETRVAGYVKNFSVVQAPIETALFDQGSRYSSQFVGRLMVESLRETVALQLHYELGTQFNSQRPALFAPASNRNNYRLSDIKSELGSDNDKTLSVQNLDRLNLQWQLDQGDLTIGRQAITFGSARILNPTDVFLPFDVRVLNTEYRIGIDAVRFQKPIGQLSEIDLGYVFGDNSERSAMFSRIKTNFAGSDFELTAMAFSEQRLLGIGTESTLGPFGAWLEFAHVNGDASYNRASIGLDYGFNENWFGMLEFHYNGAGSERSLDYLNQLQSPGYQFGGVFLLGQRYLAPSLSWQVSALSSLTFQVIANLDDRSAFASIGYDRSLSDNFYLGGSLYLFNGEELEPVAGNIDLGSEYGNSPAQLIINLRYYL
jgi:hypothetical protein